jgi:hypothetical protein
MFDFDFVGARPGLPLPSFLSSIMNRGEHNGQGVNGGISSPAPLAMLRKRVVR